MKFDLDHLFDQSIQFLIVAHRSLPGLLQQPTIRTPIAISLGAIAGSLTRYYLTVWFVHRWGNSFPFGTLFINITGSFGMGFFVTFALEGAAIIPPEVRLLIAVGFLGSYTTFSTYELDTINLLRQGNFLPAGFYWMGSAIMGILSLQLGTILARYISKF